MGRVLHRHGGDLGDPLAVDADLAEAVRYADGPPELDDPVDEALEPAANAEIGGGTLDRRLNSALAFLLPFRGMAEECSWWGPWQHS